MNSPCTHVGGVKKLVCHCPGQCGWAFESEQPAVWVGTHGRTPTVARSIWITTRNILSGEGSAGNATTLESGTIFAIVNVAVAS